MRHPKGTRARVLLSSVFKPFAQDDEYGSRVINPVELYHNQVTRAQGPFSLRMFHRSWGLMFIHQNISAPCTLLDFPTRERFVQELTAHDYDVVGISSIVVNIGKVREMCRLVRRHSPRSTIVVAGHVTSTPGIEKTIDADHVVRGEGVAWMRAFLGEDADRPFVTGAGGCRGGAVARWMGRRALGDGAVSAGRKPLRERAHPGAATGYRARVRDDDRRDQSRRRPGAALVLET